MGWSKYASTALFLWIVLNVFTNDTLVRTVVGQYEQNEDLINVGVSCAVGYLIVSPLYFDSTTGAYISWFTLDDFLMAYFLMVLIVGAYERFSSRLDRLNWKEQLFIYILSMGIYKWIGYFLLQRAGPVCLNTMMRYTAPAGPYLAFFTTIGALVLIGKLSKRRKKRMIPVSA